MTRLAGTLRRHVHFCIIMPLVIIVMTWPLAPRILNVDSAQRPPHNADVLMKFWDAWYGKHLLMGRADYFHTDLLFHPVGLSLDYHNFSIPHMLAFGGLQAVMPAVQAYMLVFLIIVFGNALASYVLLLHLFRSKWIALAGAAIFSFSPYFFTHIHHPDVTTLATIPLTVYCFHRGVFEQRWKWLVAAGALAGFTAFIGMYIFVCLFITVGTYALRLAATRWRLRRFWAQVALVLSVAGAISLIRVYPMIIDANLLSEALDKNAGIIRSTDLLTLVVNPLHPLTPALFQTLFHRAPPSLPANGYLGLVPIALIILGFIRSPHRRSMAFWLFLAVCFAILRLDHFLQIDGRVYSHILLPKYYLDTFVPWLTKAFWDTSFFQIGILLPLAMLVCLALQALLRRFSGSLQAPLVVTFIILVAFEYYRPPIRSNDHYRAHYRWIDWLATEPDQDSIHLINLPMGRNRSKRYLYHQTLHGHPQVEGLASRTPASAYDYIEANLLLRNWRANEPAICLPGNRDKFLAAQAQLLADGFTHVVLHNASVKDEGLAASFLDVPAAYVDEHVLVFRLSRLRETCDATAALSETIAQYMQMIEGSEFVAPDGTSAVLAIYPLDAESARPDKSFLTALKSGAALVEIDMEDILASSNSSDAGSGQDGYYYISSNNVIAFAYDPAATPPQLTDRYRSWLVQQFKACDLLVDGERVFIEVFIRHGFPCGLTVSDAPLAVSYDNGIQLGNLLTNVAGNKLDLYLLWKRLPEDAHAISVQLFDDEGAKALGQDFVFHHDALGKYHLDLSSLEPGRYDARLIVYNYETGASVSGKLVENQARFDRELPFLSLALD